MHYLPTDFFYFGNQNVMTFLKHTSCVCIGDNFGDIHHWTNIPKTDI